MLRLVSPAGTPIRFADHIKMAGKRLGSGDASLEFGEKLKQLTGAKHCFLFGSGRAALTCLLTSLIDESDPARDEVVIPAYTCFSVPAAIIRAGFKVRPVDIDPENLDYNAAQLSRLNLERVRAIIGCNLFGVLTDMDRLRQTIGDQPVTLIDDAAQSLGCRIDGRASGCRGRAGLYSLGRGKNLSAYAGGVLVTDDTQLAERVGAALDRLSPVSPVGEISTAVKIALAGLLLRPSLYWIPANLPFLGLGLTIFDTAFDMERLSPVQAALGSVMIDRLAAFNAGRREIGTRLAPEATATGAFRVPGYHPDRTVPVYLRLPLLARDRAHRNRAIAAFRKAGVTASIMYPSTIGRIDGITEYIRNEPERFPGAESVVDLLLTLPTHGYVTPRDVDRMAKTLRELG
jgi:dTDP-4-amino-4,6-dideoxygalactose transaminase